MTTSHCVTDEQSSCISTQKKEFNISVGEEKEEEEEGNTYGEFLEEETTRLARTEFDTIMD